MEKWKCSVCGYVYNPDSGFSDESIAPETPFEQLPDSWICPVCGAPKSAFEKE